MGRKGATAGGKRPSIGEIASQALLRQVEEARSHVGGAIQGDDPEELHDLRVAVRRMRAAIRLFERALPAAQEGFESARIELRQTGAILGRARDLDVQVERLERWLIESGQATDPSAKRAVQLLAGDRTTARRAMRRHLRGTVFLRRLAAVEAAAAVATSARARRTSVRLLRRPSKQVMAGVAGARSSGGEPAAFHALRIDVKRLRYALEFLEPALPFSTKRLVRRLREAQDRLGALQDAAVERSVALQLMERAAGDTGVLQALDRYRAMRAQQEASLVAECAGLLDTLESDVRRLRGRL